jgi:hypothetical protein
MGVLGEIKRRLDGLLFVVQHLIEDVIIKVQRPHLSCVVPSQDAEYGGQIWELVKANIEFLHRWAKLQAAKLGK